MRFMDITSGESVFGGMVRAIPECIKLREFVFTLKLLGKTYVICQYSIRRVEEPPWFRRFRPTDFLLPFQPLSFAFRLHSRSKI